MFEDAVLTMHFLNMINSAEVVTIKQWSSMYL